jgi:hypothetical protein
LGENFYIGFLYGDVTDESEFLRSFRELAMTDEDCVQQQSEADICIAAHKAIAASRTPASGFAHLRFTGLRESETLGPDKEANDAPSPVP